MRSWSWSLVLVGVLLSACGDDDAPLPEADAGTDAGTPPVVCGADSECDDGLFCNGAETCSEGACLAGTAPDCDDGVACTRDVCSEERAACVSQVPDADGDGYGDAACEDASGEPLGRDCDDADADRFPGNAEVCDVDGHDEDCDPATFGFRDLDGDGHVPASCCNGSTCGDDCDDMDPSAHPTSVEVCDGRDNDCDGSTDERVFRAVYADDDGDGYGDPTRPETAACDETSTGVENGLDCDDGDPMIRPGVAELCNGRDDNCDGIVEPDADGDGHLAPRAVCTGGDLPRDDCNDLDPAIHPGALELCDLRDGDCDGRVDERVDADLGCVGGGVEAGYCLSGTCWVGTCEPGRGDCDEDASNGCEADLAADAQSCGACGVRCPFGTTCRAGLCDSVAVVSVDAGAMHSCFVTDTGRVGCFGANSEGQLGDRTRASRTTPVEAVGVSDATEVQVGLRHSCAVRDDGTVVCWGSNVVGQLGDGTTVARTTPEPVTGPTAIGLSIADERDWSCEVDASGRVLCWGHASYESGAALSTPTAVEGVSDARAIATSALHACVLDASGAARCWGSSRSGELGDGLATREDSCFVDLTIVPGPPSVGLFPCSEAPVTVLGLSGLEQITVGDQHSCARSGAQVHCWGANGRGQLGTGSGSDALAPVLALSAPSGRTVVDLDAGAQRTCAVDSGGTLYCWGAGSLGDGSDTDAPTPRTILEDVADVATGSSHTCAVSRAGALRCWGGNFFGQLGDRSVTSRSVPTAVVGLDPAVAVVGSQTEICARTLSGRAVCWGLTRARPEVLATPAGVVQLAASGPWFAARTHEGRVLVWYPDEVPARAPEDLGVDRVRHVAVGGRHGCVAREGGDVRCWGANELGQLGDGTTSAATEPVAVGGLSGAVEVAVGARHSCARLLSGHVRCWGANDLGQLGDGTSRPSAAPVEVAGIADAIALVSGQGHTCVLHASRRVSCWGDDEEGQLGDGLATSSGAAPRRVVGLDEVVSLAAGAGHTCAVRRNGDVLCWGSNTIGQSGQPDAGTAPSMATTPTEVQGTVIARAIGAGDYVTCAIEPDGAVRCWGDNRWGQIGDGGWNDCEVVGCLPGRRCDPGDCDREEAGPAVSGL